MEFDVIIIGRKNNKRPLQLLFFFKKKLRRNRNKINFAS